MFSQDFAFLVSFRFIWQIRKPLVCVRAAIFVEIGAENFSEMCVRGCGYIVFKVRKCAQGAEVRAHVRTSIFFFL